LVLVLGVAVGGCRRSSEPRRDHDGPTKNQVDAQVPKKKAAAEDAGIPPLVEDEAWLRARKLDPLDLGQLADREGALGLISGLYSKGPAQRVAREALPYAPDVELAIGRYCAWIDTTGPKEREAALGILVRMLDAPNFGERLDVPGEQSCLSRVRGWLSGNPGVSLVRRAEERLVERLGDGGRGRDD
jgi:hypothetical protein